MECVKLPRDLPCNKQDVRRLRISRHRETICFLNTICIQAYHCSNNCIILSFYSQHQIITVQFTNLKKKSKYKCFLPTMTSIQRSAQSAEFCRFSILFVFKIKRQNSNPKMNEIDQKFAKFCDNYNKQYILYNSVAINFYLQVINPYIPNKLVVKKIKSTKANGYNILH